MFDDDLRQSAEGLIKRLSDQGRMVATAESCTGGLIAAVLTEIPGSSSAVERGYVTYSNEAKNEALGVDPGLIDRFGAVSAEVAGAMATGALARSRAQITVAVTGIAGPGGATPDKPVGLVHIAVAQAGTGVSHRECRFGEIGRSNVRLETVRVALAMLTEALDR